MIECTLPNLHLLFRSSICVIKLLDSSKDKNLLFIKFQINRRFPTYGVIVVLRRRKYELIECSDQKPNRAKLYSFSMWWWIYKCILFLHPLLSGKN